jgi:UDP-3-O-[3-hydroxymyristoyl] glucosamine N-acyltransferase
MIAGQVGIVGHIKVGNRVTIAAQSGVTRNIDDDSVVLGSPAMPADRQKKIFVLQRKLEGMYNDIQELKRTVASLQQSPDQSGN